MNTSKYRAVATHFDGIRFASKREADRYFQLKMLEKAGEISGLELQPVYELTVETYAGDEIIGRYRADFRYFVRDRKTGRIGDSVVEDAKGFKTPLYRWKKKHVEAQYGIEIREV